MIVIGICIAMLLGLIWLELGEIKKIFIAILEEMQNDV